MIINKLNSQKLKWLIIKQLKNEAKSPPSKIPDFEQFSYQILIFYFQMTDNQLVIITYKSISYNLLYINHLFGLEHQNFMFLIEK